MKNKRAKPVKKAMKKSRRDMILDALENLLASHTMAELDVEPIAAEAGITRTRFYHYFSSKNDALAALLVRLENTLKAAYDHPQSWFLRRPDDLSPRESLKKTIEHIVTIWWPHRFVLREASDLWTLPSDVKKVWLDTLDFSVRQTAEAIQREREVGLAPPGADARYIAEALIWQAERIFFRAYAGFPGAMSKSRAKEITLEIWMRAIYLDDDPKPK